jgi:mono/diheme cytochrome c family protein
LGERTDEEIKAMIQLGLSRRDHQLFPLMPYQHYNTMAEDDLDALVAYLRSIEPIDFETPHPDVEEHHLGERPHIDPPEDPLAEAPAPTDIEARGDYLFNSVLLCTNCHTPRNPDTGQPDPELYLSGGQPFEGAWGIVYGGNITPHDDTGIGSWSDEDIKRVLAEGIRPDGRRVVVMPSSYLSVLTEEDLDAIVYYLRNVGGFAPRRVLRGVCGFF